MFDNEIDCKKQHQIQKDARRHMVDIETDIHMDIARKMAEELCGFTPVQIAQAYEIIKERLQSQIVEQMQLFESEMRKCEAALAFIQKSQS